MRAEIPAIDQERHTHRHDNSRALALQRPPPRSSAEFEREARTKHLFEKCLPYRGQRFQPERIHDAQMIRLANRLLRRFQHLWQRAILELLLGLQPGKSQPGHLDGCRVVARLPRSLRVGFSKRVAEMAARDIGMALDDHEPGQATILLTTDP